MGFRGHQHAYISDPWNQLDFLIVTSSWLPLLFPTIGNYSSIRALRALRPLRTIRRLPKLKHQVDTIVEALPFLLDVGAHMHACTCMHACTYMHAHTCMHIHACTRAHLHTRAHVHTCTHTCMHTCMHAGAALPPRHAHVHARHAQHVPVHALAHVHVQVGMLALFILLVWGTLGQILFKGLLRYRCFEHGATEPVDAQRGVCRAEAVAGDSGSCAEGEVCTLYPVPCTLYRVPCTLLRQWRMRRGACLYPVPCTMRLVPC